MKRSFAEILKDARRGVATEEGGFLADIMREDVIPILEWLCEVEKKLKNGNDD